MSEQVRLGLIGAGAAAAEQRHALASVPGAVLAALVGDDASGAPGERALPDAAALAASRLVDAVIVTGGASRALLAPLVEAGLPILCAPPIAASVEEWRRVIERAGKFWTAMAYRYRPPVAALVEEIRGGTIGALRMLTIRQTGSDTAAAGGADLFDLMRLVAGAEAVRVYCSGGGDGQPIGERAAPDLANSYTIVDFANGVRAMLDLSADAPGAEAEEIAAVGGLGRLEVTMPDGAMVHAPRAGRARADDRVPRDAVPLAELRRHALVRQLERFTAAVRGEGPVEVTATDGLHALAIAAAARLSAREARVVAMAELGF